MQASVGMIRRNPWKSAFGVLLFLGAIPAAVAGYSTASKVIDPALPALHYWVSAQLAPLRMVQNSQALAIDRFLLWQQQQALEKAQSDPAAKNSPTAQDRIRDLKDEILNTQQRIKNEVIRKY